MRSVNKVILIGNLTRDPEMRQTPNGQQVATFGLATNREWVTRDGIRHTSSEYHEVVAWSRLADICGKYLKKGKLVYIDGYLKTRSWDTPEGTKKFKTEIVIQDMIMLEKRPTNTTEEYIPEEVLENNHAAPEMEDMEASSMPESTSTGKAPVRASKRIRETAPEKSALGVVAKSSSTGPSSDIDADLGL